MSHQDRIRKAHEGLCRVCLRRPGVDCYAFLRNAQNVLESVKTGFFCTMCNIEMSKLREASQKDA